MQDFAASYLYVPLRVHILYMMDQCHIFNHVKPIFKGIGLYVGIGTVHLFLLTIDM